MVLSHPLYIYKKLNDIDIINEKRNNIFAKRRRIGVVAETMAAVSFGVT